MKAIDYVACLDEMYQSQGFPPYRWSAFDSSPWTSFDKALGATRLALVTSAGVFMDDQQPFDPWAVNDLSFRKIPVDTRREHLKLHHNYFDHRDALKDLNCVFPVQRLKELEKEGHIGALVPLAISLGMGRLYKRTALQKETVPKIMEVLEAHGTNAALLVPA